MPVTIRFTTTDSFISEAIRFAEFADFSHSEIELPDGSFIATHWPEGVQIKPHNYAQPTREAYGIVDCPDEVTQKVLEFAKAQVGKPYDVSAIFGIVFRRDWHQDGSWDCSEMIAAAFDYAGFPLLNNTDRLNRVTPDMLYQSPLVHIQP